MTFHRWALANCKTKPLVPIRCHSLAESSTGENGEFEVKIEHPMHLVFRSFRIDLLERFLHREQGIGSGGDATVGNHLRDHFHDFLS